MPYPDLTHIGLPAETKELLDKKRLEKKMSWNAFFRHYILGIQTKRRPAKKRKPLTEEQKRKRAQNLKANMKKYHSERQEIKQGLNSDIIDQPQTPQTPHPKKKKRLVFRKRKGV